MESTSFTHQMKPLSTLGETTTSPSTSNTSTGFSTASTITSCLEIVSPLSQASSLSEEEIVQAFLKAQTIEKQKEEFSQAVKKLPASVQDLLSARGIFCCNWDYLKIDPTSPEATPTIELFIKGSKDNLIIDLHALLVTRQLPAIASNQAHHSLKDTITAAETFLQTYSDVELRPSLITPSYEKAKPFIIAIRGLPNPVKEIVYTHCIGVMVGRSIGKKDLKKIDLHQLVKQTIDPKHPEVMNRIENQIRNEMWQTKELIRCWVLQQKRVSSLTNSN